MRICATSRPLRRSFTTAKHGGHHDHRSSLLFDFVHHAEDKAALVAQSCETLRFLGREGDHVHLYLPNEHADMQEKALHRTALIELSNSQARNALSGRMMAELADAVHELEKPEVHETLNAVILRGRDGWFCAGADLQVARKELGSRDGGTAMSALMVDTLTRLRRLPLVSVAVIEGGAYGGGAELATACDFRIIEKNAVLQFVQARMGVSPGWGGGARLLKLVGRQRALMLLATSQKLTAEEAMKMHLADSVYDGSEEDSLSSSSSFLKVFDSVDSNVLHGAKRVISHADDISLDDVLEHEHQEFKKLWGGPANIRALQSALKK